MPRFDGLVDQERPLRILAGILEKGNIPHAFLFTGIDGIGKRTAAIYFSMACNCRESRVFTGAGGQNIDSGHQSPLTFCGQCNVCAKIMSGGHPDVIMIEPEGDVIKIAQIRELSRRLSFKPHEATARVVVISGAQAMNVEASNALLKALEEPPPQTFFFLTAGQRADLLPTVVSRCQHIRFNPVSVEKIELYLTRNHGLSSSAAKSAAIISDGSFSQALALAERPESLRDMEEQRQWLSAEIAGLPSRSMPMILMFARKLASDKQYVLPALEIMKRILRDALVAHYCPEKISNKDLQENVIYIARQNSASALFSKIDAVMEAEQAIMQNANQRLSMEVLALQLADLAA